MAIVVREAVEADFEKVKPLLMDVHELHVRLLPDVFQDAAEMDVIPQNWFELMIEGEGSTVIVAEKDGRLVGIVVIKISDPPGNPMFKPRRFAFIDEIVVDAAYQGQGIGQMLMAEVDTWVRGQGLDEIVLGVFEANQGALKFYEKLGYHTLRRSMRIVLD